MSRPVPRLLPDPRDPDRHRPITRSAIRPSHTPPPSPRAAAAVLRSNPFLSPDDREALEAIAAAAQGART